jgi:hypothetical protein
MVALEVYTVVRAIKEARSLSAVLKELPREDPPPDTLDFYNIQIPVQRKNMGENFHPMSPHQLSSVPHPSKLAVVRLLTAENEERLDRFFEGIRHPPFSLQRLATGNSLILVDSTREVNSFRKCAVKYSRKTEESILAKACRPSILAENPKYSVEHVRDTFRFKATVYSFRDMLSFVALMNQDRSLAHHRLSRENVAKLDIAKLKTPKEWGWRFLAFDFIMPNHQIVECYIVFREMEECKKSKDCTAAVCPELSNHEIFEKWRICDVAKLSPEERQEHRQDVLESNRRYDKAFSTVLSHTTDAELEAFWEPFGESQFSKDMFFQHPNSAQSRLGCEVQSKPPPPPQQQQQQQQQQQGFISIPTEAVLENPMVAAMVPVDRAGRSKGV